ncbi:MAG: hypothetical protein JSV26_10015 [bacterium]|nr:MAG: hypothetical protein JSV26_10015 [bacterium]
MGSTRDRSRPNDVDDSLLIAEIHRAEGEIDRFLESKRAEAERILSAAAALSEKLRDSGRETAQREAGALREKLLREAEEEAGRIVLEGEALADGEKADMEHRPDEIVAIILRHLLGGSA